jgi:SAM-dependent methyltransferase
MKEVDRFSAWILPSEIAGKSFLDIGCSSGEAGLYVLSHHAEKYVGIDIDSEGVTAAMTNIKTAYPDANATVIKISIEEYLKQKPNLKFDVIFLGKITWGLNSDILYKLAQVANYIVIESPSPFNHIVNDILSSYTTPEILNELEYNYPVAEIYPSNFKFLGNKEYRNRHLCVLYSIGYLKTVFNQLGFITSLDSYEKLKKKWPDKYGYGTSQDGNIKLFVIQFRLLKFQSLGKALPLTWAESHKNV